MNIRPYVENDLLSIAKLFAQHRLPFDAGLFSWKKQCPGALSYVIEKQECLMGHYSIVPMPLPFAEDKNTTGFAIDAIFDSQQAGFDVVQQLLQYTYKQAKEHGFEHLYGFPTARMATIKKFLGWNSCGQINWMESKGMGQIPSNIQVDSAWRWQAPGRAYFQLDALPNKAVFCQKESEEKPLLVWCDDLQSIRALAEQYKYLCFSLEENVYYPEFERCKTSLKQVELLHISLSKQKNESLPLLWHACALEGITLGW